MVGADQRAKSHFCISTPWYHGWNIIVAALLIQGVTVGLMTYGYTLWITSFKDTFGASQGTILLAPSLATASMGFYAPIAGRLVDKYATRSITIAGIIVFGIGYLLVSASTAIWQVILIYATLLPIGAILAGPLASQVMVARWFEKNRGTALGISTIGTSLGGVIFPPIMAALIVSFGWRLSHVILAVAAMVIIIPVLGLIVRERGENDIEPVKKQSFNPAEIPSAPPPDKFPDWQTKQILKSKTLWALIAFLAPLMFILSSIQYNIGPISAESGFAPQGVGFLLSTAALMAVLGKLMFGFLADRIDHRYIIGIAVGSTLLCVLLLLLGNVYWLMMGAIALLGLASGGMGPLMGVVIAGRYGAANFGRVYGIVTLFFTTFAFAPVIIGYLRDSMDSYTPIYFLLLACTIPAVFSPFLLGPSAPEVPDTNANQTGVER